MVYALTKSALTSSIT